VEARDRAIWKPPAFQSELTVVIPSWNGREMLRRCMRALADNTQECSVIVVDDGSKDQTMEMVERDFPAAGIVSLPRNSGFAVAANAGLARVSSPLAGLLNNDTEPRSDWVAAVLAGARDYPDYGFFASRMVNYYNPAILDSAGDLYLRTGMPLKRGNGRPADTFPKDEPVLAASAGAAVYRRQALEQSGLLDETYRMYLEDVDLSLRLQASGFRCMYLSEAVVRHREAASDPDRNRNRESGTFYSSRRVFWISRNRWLLMVTWQPLWNLPWLIYGWARSFAFHLFKAGFTKDFLRGIASGIAASPRAWKKRAHLRWSPETSMKELCRQYRR